MPLRFLFDEHVSKPACDALRERGIDTIHVLDVGLGRADDGRILAHAADEGRIVVTRNYRDFAPLVEAYRARNEHFTGVLFVPISIAGGDVGAHVRGIERWVDAHGSGENPVADTFGWLGAGPE